VRRHSHMLRISSPKVSLLTVSLPSHIKRLKRFYTTQRLGTTRRAASTLGPVPLLACTLIAALGAPPSFAQNAAAELARCPQHFAQGKPPVVTATLPAAKQTRGLCFNGFALLYSVPAKTAIYAAEHLTFASLTKAKRINRTGRFYEEARLPTAARARLSDYKGSGFDRGHLFPAGDAATPEAMAQSFSLANMVPQAPANNRGPWAKSVEKAVRKYVERTRGEVYVLTGPIYEGKVATLGASRIWIPKKLFKFVYDPRNKKSWGYVLDNNDLSKVDRVLPYSEMKRATGIEFLPGHPG